MLFPLEIGTDSGKPTLDFFSKKNKSKIRECVKTGIVRAPYKDAEVGKTTKDHVFLHQVSCLPLQHTHYIIRSPRQLSLRTPGTIPTNTNKNALMFINN